MPFFVLHQEWETDRRVPRRRPVQYTLVYADAIPEWPGPSGERVAPGDSENRGLDREVARIHEEKMFAFSGHGVALNGIHERLSVFFFWFLIFLECGPPAPGGFRGIKSNLQLWLRGIYFCDLGNSVWLRGIYFSNLGSLVWLWGM